MKFSLILCTINRTREVDEFLHSITQQTCKDIEILLVDQNKDDRLQSILKKYENKLPIRYMTSEPGLSRARNKALPFTSGEIIAFPDDDCLYPSGILESVKDFFISNIHDGLTVKMKNALNNEADFGNKEYSFEMTKKDAFGTASWVIFIRKKVFEAIGYFDEQLGLGSGTEYIGGEDYEIITRALKHDFRFFYRSDIAVLHPTLSLQTQIKKDKKFKENHKLRIIGSGASDYYILKKHFNFLIRSKILINNFLSIFYNMLKFDLFTATNHIYRVRGMLKAIYLLKSL